MRPPSFATRCVYAPTSKHDNREKINSPVSLLSYLGMGFRLADIRAAGAPRKELAGRISFGQVIVIIAIEAHYLESISLAKIINI